MENLTTAPYSVLMSVYKNEQPEFFRESLESIFGQTLQPDEVVVVCDGPLSEQLDKVLSEFSDKYSDILKIHRLPENKGTAYCANVCLKIAANEYVMKMDSDDICMPYRAKKQMEYLAAHPEIDILGGFIEEFNSEDRTPIAVREVPVEEAEILHFARRRSPFNNQTMVYKRSIALEINGYSEELIRCEDYDFMVRMLMHGAKPANLPEILVKYRVNSANIKRRKNYLNTKSFIAVRKKIYKMGFSSFWDYLIPCLSQIFLFILPGKLTGFIYKKLLRKKVNMM